MPLKGGKYTVSVQTDELTKELIGCECSRLMCLQDGFPYPSQKNVGCGEGPGSEDGIVQEAWEDWQDAMQVGRC